MDSPAGFPQLPPEGSPSLWRQKPDARNQTFGQISYVSDPKLSFRQKLSFAAGTRKFTKSLVSGIWFLSPEAGGPRRRQLGEPGRAVHSTCP